MSHIPLKPHDIFFLIMSSSMDDLPKLTHSNYHAWVPQMTAKLQHLRVWHFCTAMEKPTLMSFPENANTSEKLTAQRNLSEATWYYNDACCHDQAVGTIMTKIKPSEYSGLENKLAKEVWDALLA